MTDQGTRLADIDRTIDQAAERTAGHDPAVAGPVREGLEELRGRLRDVHGAGHQVDADTWAPYVAGLDRRLDELQVEVGRAADGNAPARPVDETVFSRLTGIELDGWRLRFDIQRSRSAADRERAKSELASLTEAAARELDGYERGAADRATVDAAMDRVRRATT